jgi:hypothetical protein
MTELQIAAIMFYILLGWFLADTFLVKADGFYFLFIVLYPVIIFLFFAKLFSLWLLYKYYLAKEKINEFRT